MSTTVTAAEDFHSELASDVEPTSLALHTAALEILKKAGKGLDYTTDEYCVAVGQAQRKTGLGSVHAAMSGRSESTHV